MPFLCVPLDHGLCAGGPLFGRALNELEPTPSSSVPCAQSVASLGGGPPGVTPKGKIVDKFNLQRIVEKRGRTGKEGVG